MKLSGNKSNPALNLEGKASKSHIMVYTAEAIRTHPEVRLTRGGLILIALLAGGDYDKVRMHHFRISTLTFSYISRVWKTLERTLDMLWRVVGLEISS
jgi:hypothetical protein